MRSVVRRFIQSEVLPHFELWESNGNVTREFWRDAGARGLLCPSAPETFGGANTDFRMHCVVAEELAYSGCAGPAIDLTVHSDVCSGYLLKHGTDAQKARWLPGMVTGELVCAVAMTEPGTGSDLKGIKTAATPTGNGYVLNGQKTFVSNGYNADLLIVVARTGETLSLFVVEATMAGFKRGRKLKKLGQLSADTLELFFDDVLVPPENLLGEEGRGMSMLMAGLPQERLAIAVASAAAAQKAYDITLQYVTEREAFGRSLLDFQVTRHKLADLKADLTVGWAYVDQCIARHCSEGLSASEAAIAKLWMSEMQGRVVDACVQLHGGYGFMREYEICRMFADARVQRIYGGTSEIMRELIGRSL